MDAAKILWQPLGEMLVERGLLTPEELEEVLQAQEECGRPLGEIIVDRALISGPTLALTLAEQCGVELTTEGGFGTGLRSEIQRRHDRENRRRPHLRAITTLPECSGESVSSVEDDETRVFGRVRTAGNEDASVTVGLAGESGRVAGQLQRQQGASEHRTRELRDCEIALQAAGTELQNREARLAEVERARVEAETNLRAAQDAQAGLQQERAVIGREQEELRAGLESLTHERNTFASRERSLRTETASVDRRARELSEQLDRLESERAAIAKRMNEVQEREAALETLGAEPADRER